MPVLHVLAGPNGAGKSTYVRDVLAPATGLSSVNADVIAARRWPESRIEHSYEAAQLAAAERRARVTAGDSFITETVFSHPSKVQLVADATALGYIVQLHVIMVPVELTVQRVTDRVRTGGHEVPEAKIRERYARLWKLVADAVRIADVAELFDNSSARHPFRLCATYVDGAPVAPLSWPTWAPETLTSAAAHFRSSR